MNQPPLLGRIVSGYQEAGVVLLAARLRLAEAIACGALTADDAAARCGITPEASATLLDALVALGVASKSRGRYRLRAAFRPHFTEGDEHYLGHLLRHQERMWRRWATFADRAADGAAGAPAENDPAGVEEFVLAMETNARRNGPPVADAVDLAGVASLLDLGGGPGTWGRLFRRRRPALRVTVLDRPAVVGAVRRLGLDQLDSGVAFRAGDFLRSPLGGPWDAIWASNVIHALPLEAVARLARRAARALKPGGRLLLRDFFLDDSRTRPGPSAIFSVHMLAVGSGGCVHTLGEVTAAMSGAGLTAITLHGPHGQSAILEGRRPCAGGGG